ncbi:MAG: flagellar basal body P-ring protein FlgI, partial [bacterium]|nr:flagellar basal body P-ring protein FlgI [bacterium]
ETINNGFSERVAHSPDPGTVKVNVPGKYFQRQVEFVTLVERMNVIPDTVAKVVINERTGTVVMGEKVRISTVAVAHGNLSIEIKEYVDVSQPKPFSRGQTVVSPDTDISVTEENNRLMLLKPGVSIGEVVRALNALGVSPRDLIAIFQAIKAAGALQAELEII